MVEVHAVKTKDVRKVPNLVVSVGSTEVARNADSKDVQSVPNQGVLVFLMEEANVVVLKGVLK
jgi:hypothetical protein